MAKCPHCGASIRDWHILTLGKENSITCQKCGTELFIPDQVSGIKVFVSTGFFMGAVGAGICVATGHILKWVALILIWFLLLALADIRYTRLKEQRDGSPPKS